jgi:hypothetical protein
MDVREEQTVKAFWVRVLRRIFGLNRRSNRRLEIIA